MSKTKEYPSITGQVIAGNLHASYDDGDVSATTTKSLDEEGEKLLSDIEKYIDMLESDDFTDEEIRDQATKIRNTLVPSLGVSEAIEDAIEENEDGIYLGDTDSLPSRINELLESFEGKNVSPEAVVNFGNLLMLNPNPRSRDLFIEYCIKHGVKITSEGYAVLYKSVREKSGPDGELLDAIGREFMRAKDQKKSPANWNFFEVEETTTLPGGYVIEEGYHASSSDLHENYEPIELIGNLQDMYDEYKDKEEVYYTPFSGRGPYGQEIHLGEFVPMPRSKCDIDPTTHCGKGLHVGEKGYVREFRRYRSTNLAVLVNPKDVVSVPNDGHKKIRTCGYFPFGVMSKGGDDWEEISDELKESYRHKEKKQVEEQLKSTDKTEVQSAASIRLEKID